MRDQLKKAPNFAAFGVKGAFTVAIEALDADKLAPLQLGLWCHEPPKQPLRRARQAIRLPRSGVRISLPPFTPFRLVVRPAEHLLFFCRPLPSVLLGLSRARIRGRRPSRERGSLLRIDDGAGTARKPRRSRAPQTWWGMPLGRRWCSRAGYLAVADWLSLSGSFASLSFGANGKLGSVCLPPHVRTVLQSHELGGPGTGDLGHCVAVQSPGHTCALTTEPSAYPTPPILARRSPLSSPLIRARLSRRGESG